MTDGGPTASTPLDADLGRLRLAVVRSVGMVAVSVAGYFLIPFRGDVDSIVLWLTVVAVVLVAVIGSQLRAVAGSPTPIARAIEGVSVSASVLIITFAALYLVASRRDPGAFSEELDHVGALYVALMTATTVGFGDVAPITQPARCLVMVQMVMNVVVLGVVAKLLFTVARGGRPGAS